MPAWLIAFGKGFMAIVNAIPALERLVRMLKKSTEQKVQDAQQSVHDGIQKAKETGRPPV